MHRNLKPDNILVSPVYGEQGESLQVKINDFALSRMIRVPHF